MGKFSVLSLVLAVYILSIGCADTRYTRFGLNKEDKANLIMTLEENIKLTEDVKPKYEVNQDKIEEALRIATAQMFMPTDTFVHTLKIKRPGGVENIEAVIVIGSDGDETTKDGFDVTLNTNADENIIIMAGGSARNFDGKRNAQEGGKGGDVKVDVTVPSPNLIPRPDTGHANLLILFGGKGGNSGDHKWKPSSMRQIFGLQGMDGGPGGNVYMIVKNQNQYVIKAGSGGDGGRGEIGLLKGGTGGEVELNGGRSNYGIAYGGEGGRGGDTVLDPDRGASARNRPSGVMRDIDRGASGGNGGRGGSIEGRLGSGSSLNGDNSITGTTPGGGYGGNTNLGNGKKHQRGQEGATGSVNLTISL